MNKNEIINILNDWNYWEKELNFGVWRKSYVDRLNRLAGAKEIVVVTGARHSGKSYILRQFAKSLIEKGINKNRLLIINFEDPRFPELTIESLETIYQIYLEFLRPAEKPFLLLDEIQEVPGWEKWVRMMQELDKAHLIISGSNANLLSQELATLLSGRHIDLPVFLLSFSEFLSFNGQPNLANNPQTNATALKGYLRKYLEEGAYPEVTLSLSKKEILLAYFDDIINKDLIKRYHIRKGEKLKALAKFYIGQSASLITHSSSAKFLGMSTDTADKFAGYLETAFLLSFLPRFSFKIKEQEKSPRKVYSIDSGLANAVGFRFSENYGRLAENLVFSELNRQSASNPDREMFYWKDIQRREVDFVIKENLAVKQLIQVCWDISRPATKEREIRPLLKALDDFNLPEALVITEDHFSQEKIKNKTINFVPLWHWLLLDT